MIWGALLFAAISLILRISRRTFDAQFRRGVAALGLLTGGLSTLFLLGSFVAVVPAGHVGFPSYSGKYRIVNSTRD
jgi:hypothetical protein